MSDPLYALFFVEIMPICSTCGRSAVKFTGCKDCIDDKLVSPAAYCSKECQRRSWKEHKAWHAIQRHNVQSVHAAVGLATQVDFAASHAEEARAEAVATTEPDRLFRRSRKLFFQKDLKGAAKCLKKSIPLQPNSGLRANAHQMLGVVLYASNDFLQAAQSHLAAMELHPVGSVLWGDNVMAAWEARDRAATCKGQYFCSCERCSELNRTISLPDWMRTPEAALPALEQIIRACPDHYRARYIQVMIYVHNRENRRAFQAWLRAVWQVAPWYVRAMLVLLVPVLGRMIFG